MGKPLLQSFWLYNKEQKHIHDQIQILESTIKDYQNPLDSPITLSELQDKIKPLQPKKACGVDGIQWNDQIYRQQIQIGYTKKTIFHHP